MNEELISSIKRNGLTSRGQTLLLTYIETGKRLTPSQAILAKCYDCMGYYSDGREQCDQKECPLFPYAPYKGNNLAKHTPQSKRRS